MIDTPQIAGFFAGALEGDWERMKMALTSPGIRMHAFSSIGDCQEWLNHTPCDLLLVDLGGVNTQGLDLITEQKHIPQIGLVNHGDISTTVRAIKAGATTCLEKPVDVKKLGSEIEAILTARTAPKSPKSNASLTPTEKTVLHHILAGKTSAETGDILHRSQRTIEVHRRNLMRKLEASNTVDLVRKASALGLVNSRDHDRPYGG